MGRVLVVAEAGVNHNGDIKIAKTMVDIAKECGADIVKFQTANLSALLTEEAPLAEYQKENVGNNKTQKEMLKQLLLSYDDFQNLALYCKKREIEFLSTPFDIESIHFLNNLVRFWKIPSGEITNYPYLVEIAKTFKPVILSTGMSTLEEVKAAVEVLQSEGTKEITLLHCTTEYPAPYGEVNLRAMDFLKDYFNVNVGYSDHTRGIEVALAAVGMGAKVIEKHFTLDRNMEGPDQKASLEPDELKKLIRCIRNIEQSMGEKRKFPTQSEIKNKNIARKSIVASCDIKLGEILCEQNITTKRPGNGISPMLWHEVLGKRALRDYVRDEQIDMEL